MVIVWGLLGVVWGLVWWPVDVFLGMSRFGRFGADTILMAWDGCHCGSRLFTHRPIRAARRIESLILPPLYTGAGSALLYLGRAPSAHRPGRDCMVMRLSVRLCVPYSGPGEVSLTLGPPPLSRFTKWLCTGARPRHTLAVGPCPEIRWVSSSRVTHTPPPFRISDAIHPWALLWGLMGVSLGLFEMFF